MLEVAVVGLAERNARCLQMKWNISGGAVVGSNGDRLVLARKQDGGRAIIVDIGVMRIADPEQVSSNSE